MEEIPGRRELHHDLNTFAIPRAKRSLTTPSMPHCRDEVQRFRRADAVTSSHPTAGLCVYTLLKIWAELI